jgi:hypothetical protein
MKQSQKLDIILRKLHEYRHERRTIMLIPLLQELNIYEGEEEANRLAKRLNDEGYAKITRIAAGTLLEISTYGIDYCEEDSFSKPGISLLSNSYHISGSNNTSIIIDSSHVNVQQLNNHKQEAYDLINDITKGLNEVSEISPTQKQDISENLQDIKEKIDQNKLPKRYQLDTLIKALGGLEKLTDYGVKLAQLFGYLPTA